MVSSAVSLQTVTFAWLKESLTELTNDVTRDVTVREVMVGNVLSGHVVVAVTGRVNRVRGMMIGGLVVVVVEVVVVVLGMSMVVVDSVTQ